MTPTVDRFAAHALGALIARHPFGRPIDNAGMAGKAWELARAMQACHDQHRQDLMGPADPVLPFDLEEEEEGYREKFLGDEHLGDD